MKSFELLKKQDGSYRCCACNRLKKTKKGLFLPWDNSCEINVKICKACMLRMYNFDIYYVLGYIEFLELEGKRK